jgi:hypothetical protein
VFSVGEAGARLNPGNTFSVARGSPLCQRGPAPVTHRNQIQLKDI